MTPTSNMTCAPFEKWSSKKLDMSKLRVLGNKAFCKIEKKQRDGNFMPLKYEGALVNYSTMNPSYCVWDPTCHTVYDIAQPLFNEEAAPGWCDINFESLDITPNLSTPAPSVPDSTLPTTSAAPTTLPASTSALPSTSTPAPTTNIPASTSTATPTTTTLLPYLLDDSLLRRNNKKNCGVPPLRLA